MAERGGPVKVRCDGCGAEMECPPEMKRADGHLCAECFENPTPAMDSLNLKNIHVEMDPASSCMMSEHMGLLTVIEMTVGEHYSADRTMKDRDIINVFKALIRGRKARGSYPLQRDLRERLDSLAAMNGMSQREVRSGLRHALSIAKRQHAVGGQRGYLDYAVELFEAFMEDGAEEPEFT